MPPKEWAPLVDRCICESDLRPLWRALEPKAPFQCEQQVSTTPHSPISKARSERAKQNGGVQPVLSWEPSADAHRTASGAPPLRRPPQGLLQVLA